MMQYPPLTQKPGRNDALSGMADLFPTILDLCEVKTPGALDVDGRSLRPLLEGESRWSDNRELIIQCPRGRERQKWKNAFVKTQRWRLVGDKLFDTENDGAEVTAQHPDVVKRLNASYDEFWNSLPDADEILSRHPVGKVDTRLCGMDWYQGANPWNKGNLGRKSSGLWAIDVEKDGRYRFELRRYPREAKKAIGATTAMVKVGDTSAETEIPSDADHAIVELELKAGSYDLETVFSDTKNKWGAYFAYVSLVKQ